MGRFIPAFFDKILGLKNVYLRCIYGVLNDVTTCSLTSTLCFRQWPGGTARRGATLSPSLTSAPYTYTDMYVKSLYAETVAPQSPCHSRSRLHRGLLQVGHWACTCNVRYTDSTPQRSFEMTCSLGVTLLGTEPTPMLHTGRSYTQSPRPVPSPKVESLDKHGDSDVQLRPCKIELLER